MWNEKNMLGSVCRVSFRFNRVNTSIQLLKLASIEEEGERR